ncbi:hypothetical protein LBMAG48_09170 [Phycisphaerae bacterium]|nr:hypothetical protein LBMAG48_09170 [Phycisphaerae bacterium]
MASSGSLGNKFGQIADRVLAPVPEQHRKLVLIAAPLLLVVAVVWIRPLMQLLGSSQNADAIDPIKLQASLEQEDRDRLNQMTREQLKSEKQARESAIAMAKYEKNDKAIPDAEAALKRVIDVMASKGH